MYKNVKEKLEKVREINISICIDTKDLNKAFTTLLHNRRSTVAAQMSGVDFSLYIKLDDAHVCNTSLLL